MKQSKSYMLYALGEVVLVVIGILIALQINGWSEVRKEREKERLYLQAIVDDLEREKTSVENMIVRRNDKIRSASKVWAIFGDSVRGDSLGFHLRNLSIWEVITPGMNTWKEIISTGDMQLIQNPAIKTGLANLMGRYDKLNVMQNTHHRREYEVYLYDQIFTTIDYNEAFPGILNYGGNEGLNLALKGDKARQFIQSIQQNLTLKNGILVAAAVNKSGLKYALAINKDLDMLVQLIKKELEATK